MRRLAWVSALAVAVACGVDLPDTPGRACDDDHPCRAGRTCVLGRCFDNTDLDGGGGGAGGGGGGAGGGSGGGVGGSGGNADAGQILWSQKVHGFTGQDVLTNCMLDIETTFNNRVVSTIRSSTQNRATAINATASTLAINGNGRLRGKFQIPQPLSLKGNSAWLILGIPSAPLLRLQFNTAGNLEAYSAAGTISPLALTQVVNYPGGFQPNVDYTLDVTWKRGQFREVNLNGNRDQLGSLTEPDGGFVKPTELRVGIFNYGGTADAGWTITLSDWALGEEPETVMP
jgi:hypothetical protein